MKHRKLRIAWSVAWGVVAVFLGVLWMRSYQWCDGISRSSPRGSLKAASFGGTIRFAYVELEKSDTEWSLGSESLEVLNESGLIGSPEFEWNRFQSNWLLVVPTWFMAGSVIIFAVVPWLSYRYSLRTMLIATTLVAAGLGVMVWLN